MLISCIVPVYKAEFYIRNCVDSLLTQTYKDIEVILVDDGSPDNSGVICDEYAQSDNRVIVIHKDNGGASDARNVGVQRASGDYLLFVDADDFLRDKKSIEHLVKYVVSNNYPDVLGFNIAYYYPSSDRYKNWISYNEELTDATTKDKLITELVKIGTLPVSPCGKMIKKKTYVNSGLQFKKGTIGEDIIWTIELYNVVDKIKYINEYYYCYRREVTTSVTSFFVVKKYLDLIAIIRSLPSLIQSFNLQKSTKCALLSFVAYELSIAIGGVHRLDGELKHEIRKELRELTWLFKYTANPKVAKVARVYNTLGYWPTEWLLRLYLMRK